MFYLIDKPKGITSFFALKKLRSRLGIKKIWHTGTLDPLASGLLLVATEQSTKLISYLEKAQKTYIFTMRMDGWTESGDLEQEVILLDSETINQVGSSITKEWFEQHIGKIFFWKISQIPSKFSAIKIDGKAAYHSARKGKEVEIPSREIEIFSIKLLDFSFPEATIEVTVSAGTYIRTLADDIAKTLWLRAYLTALRRIKINHLDESLVQDLETLSPEQICPITTIFPNYQIIETSEEQKENSLTIPLLVATRILNWLTQENKNCIKNGIYFLKIDSIFRALVEAKDDILKIERNNISD